jgi:hypothetical protein
MSTNSTVNFNSGEYPTIIVEGIQKTDEKRFDINALESIDDAFKALKEIINYGKNLNEKSSGFFYKFFYKSEIEKKFWKFTKNQ